MGDSIRFYYTKDEYEYFKFKNAAEAAEKYKKLLEKWNNLARVYKMTP